LNKSKTHKNPKIVAWRKTALDKKNNTTSEDSGIKKMPVTIFTKNGDNTIKKNMTKKNKKIEDGTTYTVYTCIHRKIRR
jgi:hypothetical protein